MNFNIILLLNSAPAVLEMRTLQVQDYGRQGSLEVGHDLHRMENTGENGDGVEIDLHAYSKKLTEGENIGEFQCSLCGKISKRKETAFLHVENIHFPGTYEHECDLCGEKFDTKAKLKNHLHHVHYSKKLK